MARESTNPALARIPALNGRNPDGSRSFPPPPTPPSSGPGAPYGAPSGGIDYSHPSRSRDPLEVGYNRPPAGPLDTGRMTVDDVIVRTAILLGTVFAVAAITWYADLTALTFPAAIIGLGLGLLITFKQITNPALILSYAVVEGVFVGGFSKLIGGWVNSTDPGAGQSLVVQAVIGTAGVSAAMLFLYKSGRIRVTPQFQRMVIMATLGFLVLMIGNLVYSVFSGGAGLRGGGLGIVVGVVAIGLASMNLVLDFDLIEKSARQGVPERYGWLAAFALTVTIVWLYLEILRLLALLTGRR
jgi:uncharacterized YccA/Bax inhibitor family protein